MNRLLLFSLLFFSLKVTAQTFTMTSTGHVYAEIIPIFSAAETAQMNFGKFSPGPAGGKIILTPDNTLSVLGSIFKGASNFNAATFYVTGDANASFTISLPSDPVYLNHTSSSKRMMVEDWMSQPGPGTNSGILQNGEQLVYVGAVLKVGSLEENPVGTYAGTYTVTFDFN